MCLMTFLTPATRFAPDEARVYTQRLLGRFRALPASRRSVPSATCTLNPLSRERATSRPTAWWAGSTRSALRPWSVDGVEPPTDHGALIADRTEVEPGFFEAAGIEIVRGRNFNDADRPDTRPVVIVSVKRWPGVSGRTSTRSAGSSGGTTPISLGSSSVWRATRT